MLVRVDAADISVAITGHALDQWRERFVGDIESMAEALRRAVPFGGQLGKDILLLDGEAVFACGPDESGNRICVRTTLTRDMAIANAQITHVGRTMASLASVLRPVKQPKKPKAKNPPMPRLGPMPMVEAATAESIARANGNGKRVSSRSEPGSARQALECVMAAYQANDTDLMAMCSRASGVLRNILEREVARRAKRERSREHAARKERDARLMKQAAWDVFQPTSEQWSAFFWRINELQKLEEETKAHMCAAKQPAGEQPC